jgi:hypothetical protein
VLTGLRLRCGRETAGAVAGRTMRFSRGGTLRRLPASICSACPLQDVTVFGAGVSGVANRITWTKIFGTKTFLEPGAHVGLALSFRIDKGRPSSPPDPSPK